MSRKPDYEREGIKLYLGDCLEILPVLEDASVASVITDPPYGIAYQSSRRTDKQERFDQIQGDAAPFVWFLPQAARVLEIPGVLVCFCRWDCAEAFRLSIGWAGLEVVGQMVWDREIHGMGDLTGAPAPMHDTVWMARKGPWKFPGSRGKSVLRFQRLGGEQLQHPTEKPVRLMQDIVQTYSTSKALVLDPFMGSGTTGVACIETGRSFIGIEKEPKYFEVAVRRIEQALDSPQLFVAS